VEYFTSKQDFKEFADECGIWIDYFGIKDWDVIFEHAETITGGVAECEVDLKAKLAVLRFDEKAHEYPNIKQTAFHEAVELLLARMRTLCEARYITDSEVSEANHEVVQTLVNTVFKDVNPRSATSKASIRRR
jgi:hypothetical protein